MKTFSAYCRYCVTVVTGKTTAITELESRNYLYIGECQICLYEVRRIVRNEKPLDLNQSGYGYDELKDFDMGYKGNGKSKITPFRGLIR